MSVGINEASAAIEAFVVDYVGAKQRKAVEVQVRPSSDDMNTIKVWVNLGAAAEGDDLAAWCTAAEAAIHAKLGDQVAGWALEVRGDAF